MKLGCVLSALVAAELFAGCSRPKVAPAMTAASASAVIADGATSSRAPGAASEQAEALGIAWVHAGSDAEVDAAFARARTERKPVFLYWGAVWCPPCNQVKATIFNRQEFIERSRAFVPVYVDGDSPGAQKLGARFKVSGYPTMVLFSQTGAELTRLPGEVNAQQYDRVLTLGLSAERPVKSVLADARAGGQNLTPNDWTQLAFYSWDTDEQQIVAKADTAALLRQLSVACPRAQLGPANRLFLKALAARSQNPKSVEVEPGARERLLRLLVDAEQSRAQTDVLVNNASELAHALKPMPGAARQQLLSAFDASLARMATDETLSRADRLSALIARVQLANIDVPKNAKHHVPLALLGEVREQVTRADREVSDSYERLAVISSAAYLLAEAGVSEESDALLQANLSKSHAPYYLMLDLASNARQRGDSVGALRWYEAASRSPV
jgi:thiol-disulfide isomerase/thioredoxin